MVCLRNICINTLHKGNNDDGDDDDDNNNNQCNHPDEIHRFGKQKSQQKLKKPGVQNAS
jgi:hypothetical protein